MTKGNTARRYLEPSLCGVAAAISLLFLLQGPTLARWLGLHLPKAMTIRSKGTRFYDFGHAEGFAYQLEVIGVIGLLISMLWLLDYFLGDHPQALEWKTRLVALAQGQWVDWILSGCLLVALLIYSWWVNDPPDLTPSNARIHWVDVGTWQHYDSYFYAVNTVVRTLLYPLPALMPMIFLSVSVCGMHLIGRKLFRFSLSGFVTASAFVISGNMLLFTPAAEDVSINFALIIITLLSFLYRTPYWCGVACLVVFLARPNLGVLFGSAMLVDATFIALRARGQGLARMAITVVRDRFLLSNSLVFLFGLFVWFGFLTQIGENYLLPDSSVMTTFNSIKPIEVEGFTISALSGAYFLHMLWVFPVSFSLALVLAPVLLSRLTQSSRRAVCYCLVATILGVLYHEYKPLFYFNIRYLSYYWPLIIVVGLVIWVECLPAKRRLLLVCALVLSTVGIYDGTRADRSEIVATEFPYSLYPHRFELWDWSDGKSVYAEYKSKGERNMLSYLFKTKKVGLLPDDLAELPEDSIVVMRSRVDTKLLKVLYDDDYVHVYLK